MVRNYIQTSNDEEADLLEPFMTGINLSWSLPCYPTPFGDFVASDCSSGISPRNDECSRDDATTDANRCFRGVHDNLISESEVDNALRLGNSLILNGGDHFDIHYDVSHLERRVPSIVKKLRLLLQETYNVDNIHPVAFRVNTVGPMDGHGVNLYRSPALALNQTVRRGSLPLVLCWYLLVLAFF
jgi:hypothetical protein